MSRRAHIALTTAAVVACSLVAACTSSGTRPEPEPTTRVVAPSVPAVSEAGSAYEWRRLPLGAGGLVTGLVIHAGSAAMYARTDVGGAYRYEAATGTWQQMLLAGSVPDIDPTLGDYSVESIAVSPADPNVVLLSVGGDDNPGQDEALPTTGRVLRSADGGHTWSASTNHFFISGNEDHRRRSERLAIDPLHPQRVLLGTRRQGLWESADGGASFHQINAALVPVGLVSKPDGDRAGVTFATFDPAARGRVFVGVGGVGVLRSDDDGASWRTIVGVLDATQVPFEGTVTAGRLLVATTTVVGDDPGDIGVYDSTSGTFTHLVPDGRSSDWSGAVDPSNPKHIVIADEAVRSGHLWRSVDGGVTWGQLDVAIDAAGIPWLDQTDLANYMSIGRLVFDPNVHGRLWFAEGMGVWRTDDFVDTSAKPSRMTWHLDSRGIEELVIADVAAPAGAGPITVAADRQGFQSTSLAVYPSKPLVDAKFGGGTDLDFSGRHPNALVWIGAEYNVYFDKSRVARGAISLDSGATWKELPNLTKNMFGGNVAVSATDPANIVWLPTYFLSPFEYLQQGKGLYVTTNGGGSWKNETVDGKNNFHRFLWWLGREALASDKVEGGVFYLQNDTKEFYVSTDGGVSWKKAANAAPCLEANGCHVLGQIVAAPHKAGEVWSSVGDEGLYRSRDRGATPWQKIPGVDAVRSFGFGAPLAAGGPDVVYLYGRANGDAKLGVWRSTDDGRTWQLLGRTPLDLYAKVTTVNGDASIPGRVYVGFGGNGVVYGDPVPTH